MLRSRRRPKVLLILRGAVLFAQNDEKAPPHCRYFDFKPAPKTWGAKADALIVTGPITVCIASLVILMGRLKTLTGAFQ